MQNSIFYTSPHRLIENYYLVCTDLCHWGKGPDVRQAAKILLGHSAYFITIPPSQGLLSGIKGLNLACFQGDSDPRDVPLYSAQSLFPFPSSFSHLGTGSRLLAKASTMSWTGLLRRNSWDFPGDLVVKTLPCNAGDKGLKPTHCNY